MNNGKLAELEQLAFIAEGHIRNSARLLAGMRQAERPLKGYLDSAEEMAQWACESIHKFLDQIKILKGEGR